MNNHSQIETQNKADNSNKDFELSHIIGLNTNITSPVQCHGSMNETVIYSVGGIVISEDLAEKNNQVFFRHGRNQISAFKISNTGKFLAVGFTSGKENFDKKINVSIILWDYKNKEIIYELTGITKAVNLIEFSQDDKFVSVAGADNYLYIWEVETGYKCFSRIYEFPTNLIYWTTITSSGNKNKPDYSITIANVNGLTYLHFFFELKSMQYNTRASKFTLPSSGYNRDYTCGLYDKATNSLYLGTVGGEISLFAIENLIFKSSFNAVNNGVAAFVMIEANEENNFESSLIIGGGDGRVKKMVREGNSLNNVKHFMTNEIRLNGRVTSLCLLSDGKEAICSTSSGHIYRILTSDLTYTLHSVSHNTTVNGVAFGKINDKCHTVDDNGNLNHWDLNDFTLIGNLPGDAMAKSVSVGDDDSLFVGYSNGFLKNFSSSDKLWEIPAHRGNVNTIYVDPNYILTGGEDGIVRVWTRKTHELIIQFSAHHKDVFNVFADINKSNIIYSCGADRSLNTFDIKLQKKVNIHNIKNGMICGIAQKIQPDYELISCGYNCNVNFWDFYQNEPIGEMNLNERLFCISVSNNGKFFAMGSESGEVLIYSIPEFESIGKSSGHSQRVNSLKWSPDDKQIVSVSVDSSICIWNFYRLNK